MLPTRFNDGKAVPRKWIGEALREVTERFGASSFEKQTIEGRWIHGGILYQDNLVRLFIDMPDLPENRRWMKLFKRRWKKKLDQLELWMVSYRVEVE